MLLVPSEQTPILRDEHVTVGGGSVGNNQIRCCLMIRVGTDGGYNLPGDALDQPALAAVIDPGDFQLLNLAGDNNKLAGIRGLPNVGKELIGNKPVENVGVKHNPLHVPSIAGNPSFVKVARQDILSTNRNNLYECLFSCSKHTFESGRVLAIVGRFLQWWRFWLFWIISSGLNFAILAALRQFYYTDDIHSDFFKEVSGPVDNWVAVIGGFVCLLLIYLLNAYYKDKEPIVNRFSFVTAIQLLMLGVLRLASAPFAEKYNSAFDLTPGYVGFSIGAVVASLVLFVIVARNSGEPLVVMVKRLLRIHREDRYW